MKREMKNVLGIFGHRVSDCGVEITLLGFPVRRIPFSNIEGISLGSKGWAGEVWVGFQLWGFVTIKKKKGLLKYVTITPKNSESFVSKVKERLREGTTANCCRT